MTYLNCLAGVTSFEDAKKILEEKNLVIKEYGNPDLYLVKYDKNECNLDDEDVRKCRGIIMSKIDNSLVCPVPPKSDSNLGFVKEFGNTPEQFIIQDFLDGTMINVFRYDNVVYISTRSCLGAKCRWFSSKTFDEMFEQCLENTNATLDTLDMDYCYSFLIQHPDNTIVKKYLHPSLVLTHVSKVSADGSVIFLNVHEFVKTKNLDISVPTLYDFTSIEDVFQYVSGMSQSEQGIVISKKSEDGDNTYISNYRTKIRNIKYNLVRHLRGNTNNKHYLFFSLRKAGNGSYENYIKFFEEDKDLFEGYRQELYSFTNKLLKAYLDCFINRNPDGSTVRNHKDIEFELKPFVGELHGDYLKTRNPTRKNTVIQYLHNLPIPRLLFAINYNKRSKQSVENVISELEGEDEFNDIEQCNSVSE